MSRGILYIVWDGYESRVGTALSRSIASIQHWHPELPHTIIRLSATSNLLDKAAMADMSPYDETLFLDADTVVMGRLDYGFEKAATHNLALSTCENPWARRYPCCTGDQVEYNAGIMFFTRDVRPLFESWQRLNREIDSSILFRSGDAIQKMPWNDQAGLALAIEQSGFNPWVLPLNWNFRPIWHKSWFGPIKIWHDYSEVPAAVADWNAAQTAPGAIIDFARAV